jgi:hypothetical protein
MVSLTSGDIPSLYSLFEAPITALDCGKKCSPYNEHGVPFCCDTRHAVPSAYTGEWRYLQANTDLWHEWQGPTPQETERLRQPHLPFLPIFSIYYPGLRVYRAVVLLGILRALLGDQQPAGGFE